MDLARIRKDFPILEREINGFPLAYLDSASTTQKPVQVLDAMDDYYRNHNANVHRGAYTIAGEATALYEGARHKVAQFIGAQPTELVFCRGTTSAINIIAYGWALRRLGADHNIVISGMEHHANVVPWQLLSQLTGVQLRWLPFDDDYGVDLDGIDETIDAGTRIVAISGMSNVLGTIGPIGEIAEIAHDRGALVVADGAQMVPHMAVDVAELGADFLVFGAHKMLGPTGIGALWGRPDILEEMDPAEGGGEMIREVRLFDAEWAPVPQKFEAGTPPIAEAIGFGAAVDYLTDIGMDEVRKHEMEITEHALSLLDDIPDVTVYGPRDVTKRGGAVSFTLADIHPHDLATILDERGIAVRAGHHCARPLMHILDVPATARASFYVYNGPEDVERLADGLRYARTVFGLDAR